MSQRVVLSMKNMDIGNGPRVNDDDDDDDDDDGNVMG